MAYGSGDGGEGGARARGGQGMPVGARLVEGGGGHAAGRKPHDVVPVLMGLGFRV